MFQGYPDVGTLPWELEMTWEHQQHCAVGMENFYKWFYIVYITQF